MDQKQAIAIVEDDDLIRQLFSDELDLAGFAVESFALGKDILQVIEKNKYDIVLLDLMLPDTNGLEILKEIRSGTLNKNSKVIILTNLGQESVIKEAYNLGANGFLIKSAYNPDQIVQEIKKIAGITAT